MMPDQDHREPYDEEDDPWPQGPEFIPFNTLYRMMQRWL